jgi:hypothetical protein
MTHCAHTKRRFKAGAHAKLHTVLNLSWACDLHQLIAKYLFESSGVNEEDIREVRSNHTATAPDSEFNRSQEG